MVGGMLRQDNVKCTCPKLHVHYQNSSFNCCDNTCNTDDNDSHTIATIGQAYDVYVNTPTSALLDL